MYDVSKHLDVFYSNHVRLGKERRTELADKREINLNRLKAGLAKIAEQTGTPHPHWLSAINQGSYAMETLNQDPSGQNNYDIDVGLMFQQKDLPENPLDARKRIFSALEASGVVFAKKPETRTNAVTVYYAGGYHIDFTIFRYIDVNGRVVTQHASSEWKERDPQAVNRWFNDEVRKRSPSDLDGWPQQIVSSGQLRRIVRLVKWFCRSRSGWALPGGMIITSLVCERVTYARNVSRDDMSLYYTLRSLRDRLQMSCVVHSPVDGIELTARPGVMIQVERLRNRLIEAIPKLEVLFHNDCSEEQARVAWNAIFNHSFWAANEKRIEDVDVTRSLMSHDLEIRCLTFDHKGGPVRGSYGSGDGILPKGLALRFEAATTAPSDSLIIWQCKNEGDEAVDGKQEVWEKEGKSIWTSTAYKGRHKISCRAWRKGQLLAERTHYVIVGDGSIPQ